MSLFNSYIKAVWGKLDGTVGLVGLAREVLDDGTAYPKIWLEDGGAADWSNKDDSGLEAVITLHIGSRVEGTKEIRGLMDKCHAALHNQDLTLESGQSVLCQFLRHDMVIDTGGITRHGVMRFNLLISEVA